MDKLKAKLKDVPQKPGVYQFKGKDGGVLYVGKAKNLKSRIGQYLNGKDVREQIPYLLEEADNFDYTIVNNELESLYLENTLIKQYLPKYNILLRDDKNYAFIKIDYATEIPQITISRRLSDTNFQFPISNVKLRGNHVALRNFQSNPKPKILNTKLSTKHLALSTKPKYFGPYSAAYKIKNTLNLVRKIFPYCSADHVSSRPCFYYYLHRCPGVCIGKISLDEYKQQLEKITHFLSGDVSKIKKEVSAEMKIASEKKEFEKAARLRDQCSALQLLEERQAVILPKKVDWDIVSLAVSDDYACINLFKVREGKMRDKENFVFESAANTRIHANGTNILQTFLEQYYLEASSVPKIIYTQQPAEDGELIEHIIRSRFNRKISITSPQKSKPKELINLGKINAEEYLKQWLKSSADHLDKIKNALARLKEILGLPEIPQRIEGYDISNIQGTNAVGSMVVFEKGLPAKSQYRKFRIKTKQTPDDFRMMKEMLARRLQRSMNQELGIMDKNKWPIPDLIVIDGGKGQLSAALEVLRKYQIPNSKFQIIGLAKRIEEIFIPGKSEPVILSQDDPALQLLQRLRDEAHRFGIAYHRKLRSKQAVRSALDDIPGIGPKTKKLLKTKFGTVANIRKVKFDDLAAVVGVRIALLIQQTL